jgi:hypothetical protein
MRSFSKAIIAIGVTSSLLFVGIGGATAKPVQKPAHKPGHSKPAHGHKAKVKPAKATAKVKHGKKANKAAKSTRLSKFAVVAEPTPTDSPICDPNVDICGPVVDPVCDPNVDICDPVVEPTPTDSPTCDANVDVCDPIVIIDPVPTDLPTPDPSISADAWTVYYKTMAQAQSDMQIALDAAQADFDAATVDAKTAYDQALASATSYAEVLSAVKAYRVSTSDQKAAFSVASQDAYDAFNVIAQQAFQTLLNSGGGKLWPCDRDNGNGSPDGDDDSVDLPPAPPTELGPLPTQQGQPGESDLQMHSNHHIGR